MSRIRTIKPEAFLSESLSRCTPLARWTFAGLWTYMDDAGKCRADIRLIKAALFALDDATDIPDIEAAIGELIEEGSIHSFMSGGRMYLHAPEFNRHQKINRPSPSTLPACPCSVMDHGTVTESSVTVQRGKGREGKGSGREGERPVADSATTPTTSQPTPTRPSRFCPKHPRGTDAPCGPCRDARMQYDAWRPPTFTPETHCGIHPEHRALGCVECAAEAKPPPDGWRPTKGGKSK